MCKKSSKHQMDLCIRNLIKQLEKSKLIMVGSCCGHFTYHMTIVYEKNNKRFELLSGIEIPRKTRSYISDKKGLMYIPEVEEFWKNRLKKKGLIDTNETIRERRKRNQMIPNR